MGAYPSTDPHTYCVPTDEPTDDNCGPVYINYNRLLQVGGAYIATFRSQPDSVTTPQLIKASSIKYHEQECFGEREVMPDGKYGPYKWITYTQLYEYVTSFAAGLQQLGVGYGDSIGIYSHNCMYWQIGQYASHFLGAVTVPVYDSLGAGAASYIVDHAECKVVLVHPTKLESALKIFDEPNTPLKHIIVIGDTAPTDRPNIHTTTEILENGRKVKDFKPYPVKPSDVAIIMYTSGSTGTPKGCVLTHQNIIAGGTGLADPNGSVTTSDTYISFLPLAHIYELASQTCFLAQGCRIGFYTGSIKNIMDDVQALRPTMMLGVPRVFNKIAETMNSKIDKLPTPMRLLIRGALKLKIDALLNDKPTSLLIDNFLFSKFRAALGGRIRFIVSGGAPILPEVYNFLRAAITPNIIQGYGLTEISAAGCIQQINSKNPMTVGATAIATDLKLRRVEGMDYDPHAENPSGEILFRGPSVFIRYHKNEELTKEALQDGWFATGDIGIITSDGTVQIIDRVKQLVKLSQGEYISLTSLTDAYGSAKGVSGIYIYADGHHNHPIAVVIPTEQQIKEWKEAGIENFKESKIAHDDMIKNLDELAKARNLRGFEKLTAILLDDVKFTIDNGLLTPSQKPQLSKLKNKYEARLIELYEAHPELRG
ncbi:AMP-binding enzyme family protein [Trichomonas vaginalis G3]|uniref:AMP-binding enzyme family protein n=1 Tax=Trichomonas vaginalis (strain ATCC PRA-98 / G3) TaxID=412133 RepID=A2EKG8_TRIV3|nr:long chain fatty acid--CoA ligase family [Trichomonas vaginalis G3]EAY06876.1 AMP-binding enzyme family protein [Trichomonas vaginalis G3]KAI5489180.1 long chain fatty acid--CoA ligase family [Trichomonas vaginalis G3]|eukprot:XP_001319099.1 AMP-binding enzyme family protein [Trichomonas vaginalis G3]